MRRNLVAGNWKMNGDATFLSEVKKLKAAHESSTVEILLCPPATLLDRLNAMVGSTFNIGGQDCHPALNGAHTGEISAPMLKDAGASYVILGHSERRQDRGESSFDVCKKAKSALSTELRVVICLGESLQEREAGETLEVISDQLTNSVPDDVNAQTLVIAYEPIWAIGTGKVPTIDQIGEVHNFIRTALIRRFGPEIGEGVRILYGGSVKHTNAAEIFAVPNVDGALVGGASLTTADFSPIITALEDSSPQYLEG